MPRKPPACDSKKKTGRPVLDKLEETDVSCVTKDDVAALEALEKAEAKKRNTWEHKYSSDEEMLEIISAPKAAAS
jgi:hypothetical protein